MGIVYAEDISVAIGMGLESARRRGYSMSDPEDDLKRGVAPTSPALSIHHRTVPT